MKLALVCPTFPPDVCGVGDSTAKLAAALAAQGIDVRVFTAQPEPSSMTLEVRSFSRPWNHKTLAGVQTQLAVFAPDTVLIQYTPYLYSPSGGLLNLALPWWITWLKTSLRAQVCVYAHELHYPIEATKAGLGRGIPQLQAFWGILAAADRVFFTYEQARAKARALMPWRSSRFFWQPIGPNIEPTEPGRAVSREYDKIVLFHFGGAHPTHLLNWTFDVLEAARKHHELGGRVRLMFGGVGSEHIERELEKENRGYLLGATEALGYLSVNDVSQWLGRATLVLGPLMDGISTRRSSVISALAHGAPVLTTSGPSTDPSLNWSNACAVTPVNVRHAYAETALALLAGGQPRLEKLGAKGLNFFRAHFSWERVAAQLLKSLNNN